jgi:uncharacterized lipoprotein YehR (DUF1307 family)
MKVKRRLISSLVAIVLTLSVTICAQAVQSQNQENGKDDPTKSSKDVDQTIPYPMDKALEAAKQALTTYGCNIKKEKADYLECTRDRHVGVMVGSGGEKVTVKLSEKGSETRVEIKTGKGFVGRLAKKNWSTPIFDEMMKTLKGA